MGSGRAVRGWLRSMLEDERSRAVAPAIIGRSMDVSEAADASSSAIVGDSPPHDRGLGVQPRLQELRRRLPRRDRAARRAHGLAHLARGREALLGVLGEGAVHDGQEKGRQVGHPAPQGLRVVLEDLVEDGVHGLRVERLVAGEQLVEDGAHREEVGALVHLLAPHLLGRHVVGRAHHRARARHLGDAQPGEAEVEDLHREVREDADVRGLQVAVDDALGVGVGEPLADLLHHEELVLQAVQALAERSSPSGPGPRGAPSPGRSGRGSR